MSTRYIHLTDKLGRVLQDLIPTDDDAFLLCLTSQELNVIRQMVFPYAYWDTRLVRKVCGGLYQLATDEEWAAHKERLEQLENSLRGEAMPCSDIKDGLIAIAEAIAGMSPGGATQTVNCGGSGTQACGLGGYLAGLDPSELLPQSPATQPDPGGDPPEGFDTWDEYYTHKCRAAHMLWRMIRNLMVSLEGIAGAGITAAAASPIVAGILVATGIACPPAAFVAFVGIVVGVGLLSELAFAELYQAVEYWDDHQDDIVCALYQSGSASDALTLLADFYEDAIEFIVFSGVLEPLAGELTALLSSAGSQVLNTNMVNVLFQVAEDVLLPDAECNCGGYAWHFTNSAEGWTYGHATGDASFVGQWTDAESGKDPSDQDAGRLMSTVDKVVEGDAGAAWWQYEWTVNKPTAYTGMKLSLHGYIDDPGHSSLDPSITYDDDTFDDHLENNPSGWQTLEVTVAGGNVGKSIKKISLTHWVGNQTTPVNFYFDHVSLT